MDDLLDIKVRYDLRAQSLLSICVKGKSLVTDFAESIDRVNQLSSRVLLKGALKFRDFHLTLTSNIG